MEEDVVRGERPIFAIFEGGGAKGVAHIGALQAIQDNRLELIGVAGTSAGALIAVLAAIGLEAPDIMSPADRQANILSRSGETPTGLLGHQDWIRFQRLVKHVEGGMPSALYGGAVGSYLFAPRVSGTIKKIYAELGHFETDRILAFINRAIRERLLDIQRDADLDWPVPDQVTFGELARGWPTVIPLKIVVTDVDNGTLEILDAHRTPGVVVAEAVAASISIPLVFKPAAIPSFRPGRFADGGLVSNLPIWGFSEEKLGYEREHFSRPPVPVIGFSLRAPRQVDAEDDGGFPSYFKRIIYAALQGSQGTATAFLDDVIIVPLEVSLGMLDFDAGWEAYSEAREVARVTTDRHLRFALEVKPDRIRLELTTIREAALKIVNRLRAAKRKRVVDQLRINLIRPFGNRSLRVMESLNMEADTDDRLLLDRRGRGAAEAFRDRGLRVFRLGGGHEDRHKEFMTKYERALVRTSVRTLVCVPIFADVVAWDLDEAERPEPSGVLALDSDEPLAPEFQDPDFLNMLVAQSAILYEAVSAETDYGEDCEEGGGRQGG